MPIADRESYLADLTALLREHWPNNRAVNIVCHGHSVPAGYFATPMVDTFNAYPHLLHQLLKARFPFAVMNVIVTAIGGENSVSGAERFDEQVLCHRPDVLVIDYALNDRGVGLEAADKAWRQMIEAALTKEIRLILLTPTHDRTQAARVDAQERQPLRDHAEQVRKLADEYNIGLVDSQSAYDAYLQTGGNLTDLLSWSNHPNRLGHELVATELQRWFPPYS